MNETPFLISNDAVARREEHSRPAVVRCGLAPNLRAPEVTHCPCPDFKL
jgi:hypothetical protein